MEGKTTFYYICSQGSIIENPFIGKNELTDQRGKSCIRKRQRWCRVTNKQLYVVLLVEPKVYAS